MPTILEFEPKVEEPKARISPGASAPIPMPTSPKRTPQRTLFADSLLESGTTDRRRRGFATTVSFVLECVAVGFLLILPLMFTEALPTQQLLTMLVEPPPPPPPPPPAVSMISKPVQTDMLDNGRLRTPSRIPQKVQIIREEQAPPPMTAGVVGGVPGGVPGGSLGGVIGGIISSGNNSASMPKLEPAKRVRISQGISQGLCISKTEPVYPTIARAARVSGVVLLRAIIDREGKITEVQLVSGHPLLTTAAIDAVRQWRYHPYLLNGEPVEIETNISVTFQLAN